MQATSATSSPYPPPPQGYMPASSQPYAPTLSTGASSPASSTEPFDYTAAIDPALDGGGTSQMQIPTPSFDAVGDYKQVLDNTGSYPPTGSDQQNHKGGDSLVQYLSYP